MVIANTMLQKTLFITKSFGFEKGLGYKGHSNTNTSKVELCCVDKVFDSCIGGAQLT